ncbi:MAG: nucleotidyltransferase substrate binding protein [Bacteroidales bacterium]|nr:nucleotidyltransferase substrate binding protein [Bacteroidales bacterium]
MEPKDIRWKQRLENYKKALMQLRNAVALGQERPFSELEEQGLIQAFEFTHELAWNVMKDFGYVFPLVRRVSK